ncbi:Outer membrane protein ImpK/VasF, OmpA/MotB domain [Pseudomonas sp. R2-37-08W]|uniref:type IVB secretion system protein IcmH/DotU n=1 Tax=Pseudomonas sp. R2-37-08W TaxID=1173273 RepID=UPI000F55E981|nr:type IVB secretion system protein IcmH/DotU [Pseudomonas sp. R2-37-08W]AZF10711.1 Outer membrane protein ImpK/VasF, OmpA/MotB domain [Pseudomonas sp. R2-37-08W]
MDSEYPQDEKTVLLDRDGHGPAQGPLTEFPAPPRYEQLQDRMIYASQALGAHSFTTALNPLVVAAWELLSQVVQLKGCSGRENLITINDRLSSAVTQFETRALQGGIENTQVMSARYVLCSVIDEAVVTTSWGARSDWSKMSLLSRFHHETFGGEKVFQLLERLARDPVKHLAMLELVYLCLSLGFEGKYRVMERGVVQLEAVRDGLYRQIRQVRGNPPLAPVLPEGQGRTRRRHVRVIPVGGCVAFTLCGLLAMYTGFAWVLERDRASALQSLQLSASDLTRTP